MSKESGFTKDVEPKDVLQLGECSLQDFRLLYESEVGMMRVFTARKSGRIFIVKTLRRQYRNDPVAIAALRKEYELSMSVDSPFVVKVYDLTMVEPYGLSIIEEYCGSTSLEQLILLGEALPIEEADAVISGICRAVDDIHHAGVVHRDIKPSNIIYNPKSSCVKVIDFGCADADNYFIFNGSAGTPQFIPPSSSEEKDSGSYNDFYALGVTFNLLIPILPDSLKGAVRQVASFLIAGHLKSGKEAYIRFQKLRKRSLRTRSKLGWIALLTVVFGLSVYYYGGNIKSDSQDASETDITAENTLGPDNAPIEDGKVDNEDPANSNINNISTDNKLPHVSDIAASTEKPDKENHGFAEGNELEKNEFGVAHAEAKYAAAFGSNEADRLVVATTDEVLMELMNQFNESPPEKRGEVLARYKSAEYVNSHVVNKLASKGSTCEPRRAAGLIEERLKLWHQTYRLSE